MKNNMKSTLQTVLSIICLLHFILSSDGTAQSFKSQKIIYNNEGLRYLSEKYLGNPNLWKLILDYNDLSDNTELVDGMSIIIPTGLVNETNKTLMDVEKTISTAANNGAKVFTPSLLADAEDDLNLAITLKQKGDWKKAFDTLTAAKRKASKTLEQALLLRRQSADATISFTLGDVQKKRPSQRIWNEAEKFSKLYEEDKARTLDDSFAEITFIDLSRIRLNENSQALIKNSKIDLLENRTETKVKLVTGDAFAYLLKSPKKKFDIDVPGLDARIKSKSFWIDKEVANTKIANYEGEIELEAGGKKVVVKENQGSIIPTGGEPGDPKELLPGPQLEEPENRSRFYESKINFSWSVIKGADKYWLEIASDALFSSIIYSSKNIRKTSATYDKLGAGIYYWRVSAIDKFDFPGEFSQYQSVIRIEDKKLPFLEVVFPPENFITSSNNVKVIGGVEGELPVMLNGKNVSVSNGRFEFEHELKNGINVFEFIVDDEAGNRSAIERNVIYEKSSKVELDILEPELISKNTIISNSSQFTYSGKTRSRSEITITDDKNFPRKFFADDKGNFKFIVKCTEAEASFTQKIITPAGYSRFDNFSVVLDEIAPEIFIDSKIPKLTKEKFINFSCTVSEDVSFKLNEKILELSKKKFEKKLELNEGKNIYYLEAKDIAGNITSKKVTIIRDSTPPSLTASKVSIITNTEYEIRISAEDLSGLKKTCKVVYSVDGKSFADYISFDSNNYNKKIVLKTKPARMPSLLKIELEDYLGNKSHFEFN